ncbi:MAG: hypothetical protein ABSE35_14905 [Bryobacteraceae bacterium]
MLAYMMRRNSANNRAVSTINAGNVSIQAIASERTVPAQNQLLFLNLERNLVGLARSARATLAPKQKRLHV